MRRMTTKKKKNQNTNKNQNYLLSKREGYFSQKPMKMV